MEVKVLLFGPAAAAAKADYVVVRMSAPVTAASVKSQLLDQHATHAAVFRGGRIAVNHTFATGDVAIASGDEVALITPVSGG